MAKSFPISSILAGLLCASNVLAQSVPVANPPSGPSGGPKLCPCPESMRIFVAYAPGGSGDAVARVMQKKLSEKFGYHNAVVDNRVGGSGLVAAQELAKTSPDGSAVMLVDSAFLMRAAGPSKQHAEAFQNVVPVATLSSVPVAIVVPTDSKLKSLDDLTTLGKQRAMNYGVVASSLSHLVGEGYVQENGLQASVVPYKSDGPLVSDLKAKKMEFAVVSASVHRANATELRVLGYSSKPPIGAVEAPTFSDISNTWTIYVPRGTDSGTVKRWAGLVADVQRDVEFSNMIGQLGHQVQSTPPESVAARLNTERNKLFDSLKKSNITFD